MRFSTDFTCTPNFASEILTSDLINPRRNSTDSYATHTSNNSKESVRGILANHQGPIRRSTFGPRKRMQDEEIKEGEVDAVRRKSYKPITVRVRLGRFTEYPCYKLLMAAVIIWNMIIGVIETDDRAAEREPRSWTVVCSALMLLVYALDIILRVAAFGKAFFRSLSNLFDFSVVILDSGVSLFSAIFGSDGAGPTTSMVVAFLRGLRMLRTFRVVRNFFAFRELYVMMQGFACAVRTLVFGLVLVFVVLTSWSILAVEVLNPINKKLTERGEYVYCERCQRAFESVMSSNLTFIKGILAGDSWGEVSVPLMEHSALASVVLVSVFVSLQWGLMNIMTAVIVDSQASSRARDDRLTAALKQEELEASYEQLLHLFVKMDSDCNGCLQSSELLKSYKNNAEFRELLNLMDISSEDLPMLFDILDLDRSGGITYHEFVKQLHTIKNCDSHTLLIFIKHMVSSNNNKMVECFDKMTLAMKQITDCLHGHQISGRPPSDVGRLSRMTNFTEGCASTSASSFWDAHLPSGNTPCEATTFPASISSQESFPANGMSLNTEPLSGKSHQSGKPEQKLDERMQLLQVSAVGSPNDARVPQLASPPLDTHALMTEWERRLHQDLADIVAYASKRVTLSGQWLQCNASTAPGGTLQSSACSPPNGNAWSDAGSVTCKASMLNEAISFSIAKTGVESNAAQHALKQSSSDLQGLPAHESHFRPKSREPKDVSAAAISPKRHTLPKQGM